MRKSRALLHLTYSRIPPQIRPTWNEWKLICGKFKDPRRAFVALMARATAELEKKLKP